MKSKLLLVLAVGLRRPPRGEPAWSGGGGVSSYRTTGGRIGMTERVLGPTGGRRRKRLAILLPFLALAALILAIGASAGTVGINAGFEDDDGNLIDNTGTGINAGIDWNSFDPVTWSPTPTTTPTRTADKTSLTPWTFKGLEDWDNSTADSAFAGGTKQADDCAVIITQKADNKADLKRVYVASETATSGPAAGHVFLMLGWVRIAQNTTSPSAHIAFEFNQNSGPCPADNKNHDGLHPRSIANGGDLLVLYDFEGGSEAPVISISRWTSSGWTAPVALTAGQAEAKVNTESSVLDALATPALNAGAGTSVDATLGIKEFGEAGIDLTAANVFPATPTSCLSFGSVFGVSRTSGNSDTAQMKDIVGPGNINISNCGSVVVKKVTKDVSGNVITNDATEFTFSTTVHTQPGSNAVANFNLTGRPAPATPSDTKTISDVKAETARSVTEVLPAPSPYALVDILCTGGSNISYSLGTGVANFDIAAGQTVTCTFTNQKQVQPSTIATAQTVYPNDSATVTGTTGDVTFELFGPFADAASVSCSGTAKFTQSVSQVSGVARTTNYPGVSGVTAYGVVDGAASEGWYGWRATAAATTGFEGRRSSCDEKVNIQITDYAGTGVKFP
jgi:hypothetical protein